MILFNKRKKKTVSDNNIRTPEDINGLVQKGEYVLSLCEDVEVDNFPYIVHHLPLIDETENWCVCDNWKLSDSEKESVNAYLKDLKKYASFITSECYRKEEIDKSIEILPPWMVFPEYTATSLGWRMGLGETYMDVYLTMLNGMTAEEFDAYRAKWPEPPFAILRSGYKEKQKRLNEEPIYALDLLAGRGGANWAKDICPTIVRGDRTMHGVCVKDE